MHVSLDSALGRQRRLNQVGESITQIAPDPAAAYSLRSLTGSDPKVVRVRRGSDNDERDFTASEVSSGALTSYVNAQVVAPLDIQALTATGRDGAYQIAKAAYSLRSLGTRQATIPNDAAPLNEDTVVPASGKYVCQVRRNVNGDLKSFTADEVTDGTLTSFVNESFTSSLPLDVAGSAAAAYGLRNLSSSYTGNVVEVRRSSDDTIKSFTAAEVADKTLRNFCLNDDSDIISFADAGLAGSPAANKRMYFDGANNGVESNTTVDESSDFFVKTNVVWFGNRNEIIISDRGSSERLVNVQVYSLDDKVSVQVQTSTGFERLFFSTSDLPKFKVVEVMLQHTASTKTLELFFDGVSQGSGNYTGTSTPANRSTISIGVENASRRFNGIISDFNYNNETIQLGYGNTNTDWEDTVGSNNGTVEGSPALFTGQGYDGHVKTWYDQSGNSNNATQATPASQPKIVSAGVLVTDSNNNPEIDFNGSNNFSFVNTTDSSPPYTVLSVSKVRDTGTNVIYGLDTGTTAGYYRGSSTQHALYSGGGGYGSVYAINTDYLRFDLFNGSSSVIGVNGDTTNVALASDRTNTGFRIAFSGINTLESIDGTIKEIILYQSDQSDKRRAIEESIATANGITLGSFNRDGFVKTWYDQSVSDQAGSTPTGNHATQATADNQPKIVSAGSLLNELDFNGTSHRLDIDFGSNLSQPNSIFMVHQSGTTLGAKNDFFDELGTTGQRTLLDQTGSNYRIFAGSSATSSLSSDTNKNLITAIYNGASSILAKNGTAESALNPSTQSISSTSAIGFSENGPDYYQGTMQEFIIYNSDQTDNRTAIEANIGETYSIDLPSGVDPGFDQVDGFVETWYDQSGNGNDATQATADNQPKIVSDGVLESDGIHFDGSDDVLTASGTYSRSGADLPLSMLSVFKQDVEGVQYVNSISRGAAGNPFNRHLTRTTSFDYGRRDDSGAAKAGQGLDPAINTKYLFSTFDSGTTASGFVNGSSAFSNVDVDLGTQTINQIDIGAFNSSTVQFPFNGKIQEFILYNSDQTAKRTALETNIASEYGITLS